jgi:hypothetical protein
MNSLRRNGESKRAFGDLRTSVAAAPQWILTRIKKGKGSASFAPSPSFSPLRGKSQSLFTLTPNCGTRRVCRNRKRKTPGLTQRPGAEPHKRPFALAKPALPNPCPFNRAGKQGRREGGAAGSSSRRTTAHHRIQAGHSILAVLLSHQCSGGVHRQLGMRGR